MEPSISPWVATDVFVRKKDSGMRVTIDFRALNNLAVTDAYPMENVDKVLGWLSSKRIFCSFDLKYGYCQAKLAEESRPQTAVLTTLVCCNTQDYLEGSKTLLAHINAWLIPYWKP